jgi:hypothetical protein
MGGERRASDIGGEGGSGSARDWPPEKVEIRAMHDALASLLLMAIVVFPCFVSLETRS